jgi:hypothetical protein
MATARAFRSDKVFGNMDGHAEGRNCKRKSQSAMQEIAEKFVDLEEGHWIVPLFAVVADCSEEVGNDADGHADQWQGEGDRQRGVQKVAQIFVVVEDGHWGCSSLVPP